MLMHSNPPPYELASAEKVEMGHAEKEGRQACRERDLRDLRRLTPEACKDVITGTHSSSTRS